MKFLCRIFQKDRSICNKCGLHVSVKKTCPLTNVSLFALERREDGSVAGKMVLGLKEFIRHCWMRC